VRARGPCLRTRIDQGTYGGNYRGIWTVFFTDLLKFEEHVRVDGWAAGPSWHWIALNGMARYLIRQGSTQSTWMVFDRVKRGPAVLDDRELVRLSRSAAEAAIGHLIGQNSVGQLPMSSGWRVTYSGRIVDCRDEPDAKSLARELIKKGFRVSARTLEEVSPARRIEPIQMKEWLAE
jgi:hypothetical protein